MTRLWPAWPTGPADRKFIKYFLSVIALYLVFNLCYDGNVRSPEQLDDAYRARLTQWVNNNVQNLRQHQEVLANKVKEVCKKYTSPKSPLGPEEIKSLKRVNFHYMYISEPDSLLWCKVPKAGSSTWTYNFLKLAGHGTNSSKIHSILRNFFPKPQSNKAFKDMFKFMVVRHPFERILSAYRDKLEDISRDMEARSGYYYTMYGKHIVAAYRRKSNANVTFGLEPTWKEFITYIINTDPAKFDEHWMPIWMLCSSCIIRYNVIAKMETFAEDTQFILEESGLSDTLKVEWKHSTGTVGSDDIIADYFSQLTVAEMAALYQTYQIDFELYGYDPGPYFEVAIDQEDNKII